MRNYRAIQRIFSNRLYVLKKVIPTVLKKELFIILPYLGNVFQFKAEFKTLF